MDLFEAIHERRSVRKFKPGSISQDQIRTMLSAAMTAPSAGNAQPWRFVVVDDRAILDSIPEIHEYSKFCRDAALGILVCGDTGREKYPGYWVQDCSAATQNLLLAAHGLGLGAVWCGVHPDPTRTEKFREKFGLPAEVHPMAFVVIGIPDLAARRMDRYDAELVHTNRF
jgi:nitroreductase